MATVYDKSSLFLAPSGVSNGTVFVQKPVPIYGSEQVTNGDFSQTGAELITNGDFATDSDWNKGAGWSISGGKLRAGDVDNINAFQAQVFTNGKTYKVTYTISDYTKGSVRFQFGGGGDTVNGQINSSNGVYTEYILATVNHTSARFRGQSTDEGFTGSVDNVSVKEVGQDWTLASGWSIGEDKALFDGGGVAANILQTNVFESGKTYKITFDTLDTNGGNLAYRVSSAGFVFINAIAANTKHTITATAASSGGISLRGADNFAGSITNISVKEVLSPDGDFTFTRGSNLSATRVNEAQLIEKGRENVLLQSNQFDTTWTTARLSGLTSGQSGYDGSSDAWSVIPNTANDDHKIYQSISQTGVVTFSVYAKANGYNGLALVSSNTNNGKFFNLSNGTLGNDFNSSPIDSTITEVSNGWYRCEVVFNVSVGNFFTIYVSSDGISTHSFSGNGTNGIYIQDAQLEQGLAATSVITTGAGIVQAGLLENTPRLDYGGGATCPSLLLEPSRTNLIAQSEYFGDSYWTKQGAPLTNNAAISPEGVNNSTKLVESAATERHRVYSYGALTGGTNYTLSVFVKKNSSNRFLLLNANTAFNARAALNLDTLEITNINGTNGKVEDYSNGWYRFSISGQSTASSSQSIFVQLQNAATDSPYLGNGSSLYLFGAQLETGSYATSYIPTYGTSQTRAEDLTYKTNVTSLIGQTEGTMYVEFEFNTNNTDNFNRIFSLGDGTGSNRILIMAQNTEVFRFFVQSGGTISVDLITSTSVFGGKHKAAFGYKENDFVAYVDGVQVGADTSGIVPITSNVYLGMHESTNNLALEGLVQEALLFKTRLSNLDLAILTGATTYNTFDEMALALNYTVYE